MSANGGDKGGVYALEQWSLTGGSASSFAISVFFILPASSSERPFTRSVIYELEAMALPQPNVLNLTSEIIPLSSTRICSFITSPQLFPREEVYKVLVRTAVPQEKKL
jgi:hypothetical protein